LRWSVNRLASEGGYSRSAFASRFREVVGETPMAYLARSRLAIAATLLDRTRLSIGEVARRVGYANEGRPRGLVRRSPRSTARLCRPRKPARPRPLLVGRHLLADRPEEAVGAVIT